MMPPVLAEPTAPGVHDMPEADYFAATYALSSSGCKLLLPPSCPAKFRYAQDHPVYKKAFDYGSTAHKMVLGSGPEIEVIDAEDWRTKAAKEQRDVARLMGRIPLLRHDYNQVAAMAGELRRHKVAGKLFNPERGRPEQSLFWTATLDDGEGTVIPWRCRLDWLPHATGGRLVIPDYKSAADASDDAIRKAVGNWAYHIQHAVYVAGAMALGLGDQDTDLVFVCQEKDPPYLINIARLDDGAAMAGRVACQAAAEIFRDCTASGSWPGYGPEIAEISLPPWASRIPEGYYS